MPNYADRDQQGTICSYFLLWKRPDLNLETFDAYWGDVHGQVAARLPGNYQYCQIRTWHNPGTIWSPIEGVKMTSSPEENFDGIAVITATDPDSLQTVALSEYLNGDPENFAVKGSLNITTPITYCDEIEDPAPTWETEYDKFHITIGKSDQVSQEEFSNWLKNTLAPKLAKSSLVIKLRLHLFMNVPNITDQDSEIHAALEIGFKNRILLRAYLASDDYKEAITDMAKYVKSFQPYPQRSRTILVDWGKVTLAGQRGLTAAQTIEKVGAINQTSQKIQDLMLGKN